MQTDRPTLRLLSYEYPDLIRLQIGQMIYTYRSSHFWCQKFMYALDKGAGFGALAWFKRVSEVVRKEG